MSEVGKATAVVVQDPAQAAIEGAKFFAATASEAISDHGSFRVALSGGETPRGLYKKLGEAPFLTAFDWTRVQIFFSDERFVPADSAASNYNMVKEALLSRIPIPDRFVHRVAVENMDPGQSASLYEEGIRRVFEVGLAEIPAFDLIMLGLGSDGHTASLFPGTDALKVTEDLVAANFVPKLDSWRITFTLPLINAAHKVLFLVEGEDKAGIASQVLNATSDLPAALVRPRVGELVWILDKAASRTLSSPSLSVSLQTPEAQSQGQPAQRE